MIHNLPITLGLERDPRLAGGPPPGTAGHPAILIIDHHPDSLCAIGQALAGEAFRTETADTAEAAIQHLGCFRPDLILVEYRVPAEDGTWFARRLLADRELTSVPIVVLTEPGEGRHGHPGFGGRFDGAIEKPINVRTLPGVVLEFLETACQTPAIQPLVPPLPITPPADRDQAAQLMDAIEAGLPGSQFAPGTRASLHGLAALVEGLQCGELAGYVRQAEQLSNLSTARARRGFRSIVRVCRDLLELDADEAPELAGLRIGYLDNRRAELGSLVDALKNEDFAILRRAGHNMKGMGAAYGFAELTDIGKAIESAAKNDDGDVIEALLDQIDSYTNAVRPLQEHRGDYAARN
jgi:two-component system cell cycle response regulator DivK